MKPLRARGAGRADAEGAPVIGVVALGPRFDGVMATRTPTNMSAKPSTPTMRICEATPPMSAPAPATASSTPMTIAR